MQYMHEHKHPQHLLPLNSLNSQNLKKKSLTTKVPKKMLLLYSSLESSKVVSFRIYILADLVKQREIFEQFFFFGMSIQKVKQKGTRVGEVR